MNVYVSASASAELESAFAYINSDSPSAARRVRAAILRVIDSLAVMPLRGRVGSLAGTREIVVRGAPYIVVYEVNGDVVNVVRIRHASQGPL